MNDINKTESKRPIEPFLGFSNNGQSIVIRRWSEQDCIVELTKLLHRAYRPLADAGMHYVASHQSPEVTARRIQRGLCLLALLPAESQQPGRIVGAVVFENSQQTKGCEYYEREGVSSFHQFAVDPDFQGCGIGQQLLQAVEAEARNSGALELALDTAETAAALIAKYRGLGFEICGRADWDSTNYESVIMTKLL